MAIKGLEQAVENLSRISRTAVPGAAAMAINRVASSAISLSASQVARETKVRRKLVKERARLKRATVKNPQARIKVNRGDLPVIKLGNARIVLSRRRRRKKGQQALLAWFNEGDTRAYKIRFPNGTVDVFRGWVSSIGKAVTAKEVITRTVKVTNVGRPSMAEDRSTVTAATGMTVTPASASVVKGQSTTLTVAFQPEGVTDKSFRAVSADKTKATVSVSGMTITVNGVAAGKVNIPVVSSNGEFAAVAEITVTAS